MASNAGEVVTVITRTGEDAEATTATATGGEATPGEEVLAGDGREAAINPG